LSAPDPRYEIVGETWVADPRERWARAVAQLIDKPLFVVLAVFAFAAAVRGPGLLIPGYEPSDLVMLGLWLCLTMIARMGVNALLAAWRRMMGISAPTARGDRIAAPSAPAKE
jgi:hypothetical protein